MSQGFASHTPPWRRLAEVVVRAVPQLKAPDQKSTKRKVTSYKAPPPPTRLAVKAEARSLSLQTSVFWQGSKWRNVEWSSLPRVASDSRSKINQAIRQKMTVHRRTRSQGGKTFLIRIAAWPTWQVIVTSPSCLRFSGWLSKRDFFGLC